MSNSIPSFLGQVNQTGPLDSLFLLKFTNEILASFNTNCLYNEKTVTRGISQGKSAQFPAMGRIGAEYHTPGHQLLGLKMSHAERIITVDGMLVSHAFIAEIDELRNHYDVRSQYSRQMGQALAEVYDKHVASTIYQAARSGPTIVGEAGGTVINGGVNIASDPVAFKNAMFACAQVLDENNIPSSNRYAFVSPEIYYLAAQTPDLINKDWDGDGSMSKGVFGTLAGIALIKSNNTLAGVNFNDPNTPAKYRGDYSNAAFHVFHESVVGTVKLLNIAFETTYQADRLGNLLTARYAVGHGILRPECAVEVRAV